METLNIDKEKAINAYQEASDEQKQVLEKVFGSETFRPKAVMDRIKTFDDALRELGCYHCLVRDYNRFYREDITQSIMAYLKLCIITEALNEGWCPKFAKSERLYHPYFVMYSYEDIKKMSEEEKSRVVYRSYYDASAAGGISYSFAGGGVATMNTGIGDKLAFKTRELAEYAGKQFIKLYADYFLKY